MFRLLGNSIRPSLTEQLMKSNCIQSDNIFMNERVAHREQIFDLELCLLGGRVSALHTDQMSLLMLHPVISEA